MVEDEIPTMTSTVLWDVTRLALAKAGFNVIVSTDPVEKQVTSGWSRTWRPSARRAFREQALVRYRHAEEDGHLVVEVRVRRELNMDIVKPLDPTYADWQEDEDNEARAQIIMGYIKAYTGTEFEVTGEGDSEARR